MNLFEFIHKQSAGLIKIVVPANDYADAIKVLNTIVKNPKDFRMNASWNDEGNFIGYYDDSENPINPVETSIEPIIDDIDFF